MPAEPTGKRLVLAAFDSGPLENPKDAERWYETITPWPTAVLANRVALDRVVLYPPRLVVLTAIRFGSRTAWEGRYVTAGLGPLPRTPRPPWFGVQLIREPGELITIRVRTVVKTKFSAAMSFEVV